MQELKTMKRAFVLALIAALIVAAPLAMVLAAPEASPGTGARPGNPGARPRDRRSRTRSAHATLITSVVGCLSLIAGFIWKGWSDARDHRWLMEATARNASTPSLALYAENTRLTKASAEASAVALDTANHANEKIAALCEKLGSPKQ